MYRVLYFFSNHIKIPFLSISSIELITLSNITDLIKIIGEIIIISITVYKLINKKHGKR